MIQLKTNYWELYPRREDITLRSLERLTEGVGVQIRLDTGMKAFSHFLYTINDGSLHKSADGQIVILFEDRHTPEAQSTTTTIKAVSKTGACSKSYTISINYYPKELYEASGQTAPGWVIVQNTDIFLSSSHVEDWILQHPTAKERAYAQNKWGSLIADAKSDYEGARALAKSIINDLEPHRGIPSDEMGKLSPFKQYERVMTGKDRLWCGNIAAIFSYACNALGIPCRRIGMNYPWPPNPEKGYRVLLAEGHGATEIFSEQQNQWIWIDLTFYILGAYLREEGPINMAELYQYLNDPNRGKGLLIVEYDPTTKMENTIPVMESKKKKSLFNYFKRDQQFRYSRRHATDYYEEQK
jgi:hypothetical protein